VASRENSCPRGKQRNSELRVGRELDWARLPGICKSTETNNSRTNQPVKKEVTALELEMEYRQGIMENASTWNGSRSRAGRKLRLGATKDWASATIAAGEKPSK
jgi:hypothetical protein